MCGRRHTDMPTLWLGKSIEGIPTYAGKKILRPMQNNNDPSALLLFMLCWLLLYLLQFITLLLYGIWVFLFFPLWLPLLIIGYFYYQTKVLALKRTQNLWISIWKGDRSRFWTIESDNTSNDIDYHWLLESICAEVFLEALPQIFIQYSNNMRRGQWSILAMVSFFTSLAMVLLYIFYQIISYCYPKLRPQLQQVVVPTSPPNSPRTRIPNNSEHGLELTSIYSQEDDFIPDRKEGIISLSDQVSALTNKFQGPEQELWMLLISNQKDLRMATLLRAYGLVKPKQLIRCSDHALTQLRALLLLETSNNIRDSEEIKQLGLHFDLLCVKMHDTYPDSRIMGMVKGVVAFASGKRTTTTTNKTEGGETASPEVSTAPGARLYNLIVPLLVRNDSNAAALIRQSSQGLNDDALRDLNEEEVGEGESNTAPQTDGVELIDIVTAAGVRCWIAITIPVLALCAGVAWIIWGDSTTLHDAEGPPEGVYGAWARLSSTTADIMTSIWEGCTYIYSVAVSGVGHFGSNMSTGFAYVWAASAAALSAVWETVQGQGDQEETIMGSICRQTGTAATAIASFITSLFSRCGGGGGATGEQEGEETLWQRVQRQVSDVFRVMRELVNAMIDVIFG